MRFFLSALALALLSCSNATSVDAGTDGQATDATGDAVVYCTVVAKDSGLCGVHADACGNAYAIPADGTPTTVCPGHVYSCTIDDAGVVNETCTCNSDCPCTPCVPPP